MHCTFLIAPTTLGLNKPIRFTFFRIKLIFGDLGIIYSDTRNGGRLPYYHRLDMSLKRTFKFSKYSKLEAVASVTNVYNRENIFFVDRVTNQRVNQLPILPSLGLIFNF